MDGCDRAWCEERPRRISGDTCRGRSSHQAMCHSHQPRVRLFGINHLVVRQSLGQQRRRVDPPGEITVREEQRERLACAAEPGHVARSSSSPRRSIARRSGESRSSASAVAARPNGSSERCGSPPARAAARRDARRRSARPRRARPPGPRRSRASSTARPARRARAPSPSRGSSPAPRACSSAAARRARPSGQACPRLGTRPRNGLVRRSG